MLLILEIAAIVAVWRKGWGARALIPLGIGLVIGFMMGLAGVTNLFVYMLGDVAALIALAVMYYNPPDEYPAYDARPATPYADEWPKRAA